MPREGKKRGRKAVEQRIHDDSEASQTSSKRRRTQNATNEPPAESIALEGEYPAEDGWDGHNGTERRFFGMLDEQEQEYFKNADQMLEVNQFRDADERSLFIQNLHTEASGKELKLACGQTGSRVLERLILLSNADQLKGLFQQFEGEYIQLMSHRFASHCCEALFRASAPIVSEEVAKTSTKHAREDEQAPEMEISFKTMIDELEGSYGYMMTNKFASHCLRLLLLILAGKPLDVDNQNPSNRTQHGSLLAGKHKEDIAVAGAQNSSLADRDVPPSFYDSLDRISKQIVSGLDTDALRSFATHPIANPTLQLLLQLELTMLGKQRGFEEGSILKTLLPDDNFKPESASASFINGILFDPVGSHMLETIIQYAPGKTFKMLYKELFKDRLPTLARHDAASYVVCRILERLSGKDLNDSSKAIIAEVPILIARARMNVLKTVAERLHARGVDATPFSNALRDAVASDKDVNIFSLPTLLQLPDDFPDQDASRELGKPLHIKTSPAQNAASFFVQALLRIPGPLSDLIFDALTNLNLQQLRCIAHTSPLSPILQVALTDEAATIIFRRKLATQFYGSFAEFSVSPSASHVVDAVEVATRKSLAFVRERIAEELSESENMLRENPSGRKVWRNWNMDLYRRDRNGWIQDTRNRVGNNGFQSFPGLLGEVDAAAKEKGKNHMGRVKAALEESAIAAGETGKKAHQTVHENVCEPIRVKSKTALDRARDRYAQRQPAGLGALTASNLHQKNME